ncbi:unnamed protein product [Discula destructiva]
MTSNGSSRHMACKFCRDRKVRCGGEQPVCEKCRRAGETCVYLPTRRSPTKAGFTKTINTLQKRLEEAEERIYKMGRPPSNTATPQPQMPYGQLWPTNPEYMASTFFQSQMPALLSSEAVNHHHLSPTGPSARFYPRHGKSDEPAESTQHDMMDSLDTPSPYSASARTDPLHFPGEDAESGDNVYPDLSARLGLQFQGDSSGSYQPREQSLAASSGSALAALLPSSMSRLESLPTTGPDVDEIYEPMMTTMAGFATAIFQGQAEICGISGVLTEHVAWLRKSPPGMVTPSGTNNAVYTNVLETIEIRLREIREIAETKHQQAFEEMAAAIKMLKPAAGGSVAAAPEESSSSSSRRNPASDIGELVGALQKQTAALSQFFQQRYNACVSLSEQIRSLPPKSLESTGRG